MNKHISIKQNRRIDLISFFAHLWFNFNGKLNKTDDLAKFKSAILFALIKRCPPISELIDLASFIPWLLLRTVSPLLMRIRSAHPGMQQGPFVLALLDTSGGWRQHFTQV